MRDEPDDLFLAIEDNDGRSYMMIRRVELLCDPETLQLRFRIHEGRIGPGMIRGRCHLTRRT